MKVKELIEKLSDMPLESDVIIAYDPISERYLITNLFMNEIDTDSEIISIGIDK